MHRIGLLLLTMCLAVTACGGGERLDPTKVALAVEARLAAYRTADSADPIEPPARVTSPIPAPPTSTRTSATTNTCEPVDTPLRAPTAVATDTSFPTRTPTPAYAATATVTVPADWVMYEDIVGRFSFMHPRGWELGDQGVGLVAFRPQLHSMMGVKIVRNHEVRPRGEDDEASLNALVTMAASQTDQQGFKMQEKGLWDDTGFYVRYSGRVSSLDTVEHWYWLDVAIPTGRGNVVMLLCMKAFSAIPDAWIEDIHLLLATLDVEEGMSTPTASPSSLTRMPGDQPAIRLATRVATLTEEPSPDAPRLEVLGSQDYVDGRWLHIVGEVRNNSCDPMEYVKVVATLYNDCGSVVGTDFTYTEIDVIPPGGKSPFETGTDQWAGTTQYKLQVQGRPGSLPRQDLEILSHDRYIDGDWLHIVGEVRNNSNEPMEYVKVVATLYNDSGSVVGTDFTYTELDVIPPGGKSPFETGTDQWADTTQYKLPGGEARLCLCKGCIIEKDTSAAS